MASGHNGNVLLASPVASVSTFKLDASSTALPASISYATMSASTGSTMSVPTATGLNMTLVVAQQAAAQAALDAAIPLYLLLGLGSLLVGCILLSHPRFLARLFASIDTVDAKDERNRSPNAGSAYLQVKDTAPERAAGGGGLGTGWILRGRERRRAGDQASNPFSSPFDKETASGPIQSPQYFPPPHIAPLTHKLRLSAALLRAPFSRLPFPLNSSVNLTRLFFIAHYVLLVFAAVMYQGDYTPTTPTKGYGENYTRLGLVAATQVPLVVALGVRGNLLGLLVGMGYERMRVFHKIVGRTMFVCASAHGALYVHHMIASGMAKVYGKTPLFIAGVTAYSSMCIIVLTSLPWVRRAWFGVFEVCHFIGIAGFLGGLAFHVPIATPYCITAAAIYLLSLLSSLAKTRLAHAQLTPLHGAETTLLTIPALTSGWRAGQHVRIRVPALGIPHGLGSHPFTIASAPDRDGPGLVLLCKAAGNWSTMLFELAAHPTFFDTEATDGRTTSVILEGPYGGLGNTLLPSFSSVLLVAGGSGISHALALAQDLVSRAPSGVVRARTADLVWVVRTEGAARETMPLLLELVGEAKRGEVRCLEARRRGQGRHRPLALRVKVFVSRCPSSSPLSLVPADPFSDEEEDDGVNPFPAGSPDVPGVHGQPRTGPSAAEQEKRAYFENGRKKPSAHTSPSRTPSSKSKCLLPLSSICALPGKPEFLTFLESLADETIARHGPSRADPSGICVTACGPGGLVASVRDAVRGLEREKRRGVGGVELEEEFFAS